MPRVAIVDDVAEARTLVRVMLTQTARTLVVAEAADMDEASLAHILASRPDVIVIDRRLPSGDGASLVTLVRDIEPRPPKVVLYSIGDLAPSPLLEEPDAYVLVDNDITPLAEATMKVIADASR